MSYPLLVMPQCYGYCSTCNSVLINLCQLNAVVVTLHVVLEVNSGYLLTDGIKNLKALE